MSQKKMAAPSPTLNEELNAANIRGWNLKKILSESSALTKSSLHNMGDFQKRHQVR